MNLLDPVQVLEPRLKVTGLSKQFAVGGGLFKASKRVNAVTDVSFAIGRGESFGIVGESGCGKTTLARMIVGILRPTSGEIILSGKTVSSAHSTPSAGHGRQIQMVFQNPYASLDPRWPIWRSIVEPISCDPDLRSSRSERQNIAKELLIAVGLSAGDAMKLPGAFSGGQRQRIAVARAIAGDPGCIVLDEPTSALDVSVQAQVINLLQSLREKRDLSYLMISHNLAVMYHFADRIAVMYFGSIVEIGARDDVMLVPSHPYTQMLLRSAPRMDVIGKHYEQIRGAPPDNMTPVPGCAFASRCDRATDLCRREKPSLRKSPSSSAAVSCHHV
ncbi:peptide/nickel transport system ATP-binding protein [Bosea sp. AK1]|uniref:oligopeptide/dipeptide ABC transporter ATP-binding protein n=1 Tax=Bosea sp. AK1 TaxID=2587160 RepID=UPI00116F346E|nr:ABC transporter ATP-binding protein [Bosea sp. AK1]TQI65279.1 peptide/nickel transport system ATP-binding protein [Bosea sp. AK1]